ncbi:carbohydrate kinase family protein [Catellatospora paridis]|uniref:carbohydrate kinase family protein n=1 Tax=Catellatospora paridis TaxID=1617086 RepID=UPI0012D4874A|nr:PfkB family carbohydrate kinase [Catellatospora paridis]
MKLVIVGHIGLNEDRTPHGSAVSPGGAAYACARGAAVLDATQVGVVATVGDDLSLAPIRSLGVNLLGVRVARGRSPRFYIDQYPDGRRTFSVDFGIATEAVPDSFPPAYQLTRHVHLATAPPEQQLAWLLHLRRVLPRATISVDMFEHFAAQDGALCRQVCHGADLIFMNEEEQRLLFSSHDYPQVPTVVKFGPGGAGYRKDGRLLRVHAPQEQPVDTTHAGEILAGVYLSLRAHGLPRQDCLTHAVRAASAKVTQFGVNGDALTATLDRIRAEVTAAA